MKRIDLIWVMSASVACYMGCSISSTADPKAGKKKAPPYTWKLVTDSAKFPTGFQLQLINIRDTLWAFNSNAMAFSTDGKKFIGSPLPNIQKPGSLIRYQYFRDRLFGFLQVTSSANSVKIDSVFYSPDLQRWSRGISDQSLAAAAFNPLIYQGKLAWIENSQSQNAGLKVWLSSDGIHWKRSQASFPGVVSMHAQMLRFRKVNFFFTGDCWQHKDSMPWKKLGALPGDLSRQQFTAWLLDDKIWLIPSWPISEQPMLFYSSKGSRWDSIPLPWLPTHPVVTTIFRGDLLLAESPGIQTEPKPWSTIWALHPAHNQVNVSNNIDE